jgi:hypothetical protein
VNRFVFAKQRNVALKSLAALGLTQCWVARFESDVVPLWHYGRGFQAWSEIELLSYVKREIYYHCRDEAEIAP